jgi:hypothetical protein
MKMSEQKHYGPFFEPIEADTVIVVYDSKTGAVRHVHQEVTLPGGTVLPPEKQMERAIGLACQHSKNAGAQLRALSVAPAALSQLRDAFVVDLKAGVLDARAASDGAARKTEKKKKKKSTSGSGEAK